MKKKGYYEKKKGIMKKKNTKTFKKPISCNISPNPFVLKFERYSDSGYGDTMAEILDHQRLISQLLIELHTTQR